MALLDLSFKAGLNINVAHVNYQLRINENLKEVETIQNYCQERNINLHIKTTSISKIKNLQNEARIMRYEYFNEVKGISTNSRQSLLKNYTIIDVSSNYLFPNNSTISIVKNILKEN